jgi:hypothetical protein
MRIKMETAIFLELLSSTEAERRLGLAKGTLPVWRHQGRGPKYTRIGRNIRYRADWILEYIEGNVVQTFNGEVAA